MYDRCVAGDILRTVMSSIMRRRRGLIVAIGYLLSGGLGFDNHNPQTGDLCRKHSFPRQRVSSITAILPRFPSDSHIPCAAGYYALNGNGEMTGTIWIEESGELHTPITITNTHSCGVARDATIRWLVKRGVPLDWGLPVAAETFDGELNDIN